MVLQPPIYGFLTQGPRKHREIFLLLLSYIVNMFFLSLNPFLLILPSPMIHSDSQMTMTINVSLRGHFPRVFILQKEILKG